MSDSFEPALPDLQAALPSWLATRDPASELYKLLSALGALTDELADDVEGVYADQALSTARDAALRDEWATLYGAGSEQLPTTTAALRAYLQQRASDDGSIGGLIEALLALLRTPANDSGTALVFPADGSGLVFPADGSGLGLFQSSTERTYLLFPADGSGLVFPADGSGLVFPAGPGRLEVTEDYTGHRVTVTVREWLSFDRAAFARAVQRARMADDFPSTITETP